MRKRRSIHERREEIKAQIEKLQAKEKELAVRDKVQERKARTKRLIEIGAVVESVYGKPLGKDRLVYLKYFLEFMEARNHFFTTAVSEGEKLWNIGAKENGDSETIGITAQKVDLNLGKDEVEKFVEQNKNFSINRKVQDFGKKS